MDVHIIDKQIKEIDQAIGWTVNVPKSEQLGFKKKLINLRRELKKIRYAVSESCSAAAFGESQMGKSYLVSAMMSTPSEPFSVLNRTKPYDFISEINPSQPNSTIEATGVITRFTVHGEDIPEGFLKVQLLSITDIILILCEAYYNQVDYQRESIISSDRINEIIKSTLNENPNNQLPFICEDDILDLREYLNDSSILQKKCNHILESDYFDYLLSSLHKMDESIFSNYIQLLWNRDEYIGKLWRDMIKTYKSLSYQTVVYVNFNSVIKKYGTLLDVARLDEMYGSPEDVGQDYNAFAEVITTKGKEPIKIEKSFLSSLIAELSFKLPSSILKANPFLENLDILDFPGARRNEQIRQSKLGEGKNLSTVLRRGKVSYLFNKYSAAKRISTLLFCHNNNQSGESAMGGILDKWVIGNIGKDPREREEYVKRSSVDPLFIIGTWFNKDLEYYNEQPGNKDALNSRWNRRFNIVLEKEVLKSLNDEDHWFNKWSVSFKPFRNIYLLRDYKYSDKFYKGYDAKKGTPEKGEYVKPANYPSFYNDLRLSFENNDFVKQHFVNPSQSWDDAALCASDGTRAIISSLNKIAPHVAEAREEKFSLDVKTITKNLLSLLEHYYHPDSIDEQLKLVSRQSGQACKQIDRMIGRNPYSFGKLMDTLMISESDVFELVHTQVLGEEQSLPMTNEESQIFMSAGLDSSASREENVNRLCLYLGVDNEEECKAELEDIDLDKLLSQNQMMAGKADNLVSTVVDMWHDHVLTEKAIKLLSDDLPIISNITSSLWRLYKILDIQSILTTTVRNYMNQLDRVSSVSIISDYLSMQLNEFVGSYGYNFLSEEKRKELHSKQGQLRLVIDENILSSNRARNSIVLLSDLYKQKEILAGRSFDQSNRSFLTEFPQYRRVWRWEQQLRIGNVIAIDLPDYDVKANGVLGGIIKNIKEI